MEKIVTDTMKSSLTNFAGQILTTDDSSDVFGQLYIAVFSNGTVKAGMSRKDAKTRISRHTNAGKAFGISIEEAFIIPLHTLDVFDREKAMHAELATCAMPTAGREWFKFDGSVEAVKFAFEYLLRVNKSSFESRNGTEHLEQLRRKHLKRERDMCLIDSIRAVFDPPPQMGALTNAVSDMLSERSDGDILQLATMYLAVEDYLRATEDDEDIPALKQAIIYLDDEFYKGRDRLLDEFDWTDEAWEARSGGRVIDNRLTKVSALTVIASATQYAKVCQVANDRGWRILLKAFDLFPEKFGYTARPQGAAQPEQAIT